MLWIDETVQNLIKENPNKEEFVCAAGISPSGPIHMGNFREFLTSYFVHLGLIKAGKKSRFIMSFDDFDRFRKVPYDVRKVVGDSFDKYVGYPICDIPDPFGCHKSYAEHFEAQFVESVKQFGIDCEFILQNKEYRSGRYDDQIILALKERKTIYDILYKYKSQEATEEGRESYVPIAVYCEKCHTDYTKVTHVSDDCTEITYECKCGHRHTVKVKEYHNIKLVWKADWPMRWAQEKVTFEPGGKDHGTEGSSYTVGKVIVDKVFGYKAPSFIMYEFIGIKGGAGKMSSSAGSAITPADLLQICPPEMILWLYGKVPARQSWSFCFDDEILRQYHEFDRSCLAYTKDNCPQNIKDIMSYVFHQKECKPSTVSAQLLFSLGATVNFDAKMCIDLFKRVEPNFDEKDLLSRLSKIQYWAETYSPESISKLLTEKNTAYFETLPEREKKDITTLFTVLNTKTYSLEDLQQLLYDIPKDTTKTDKENQPLQRKFFQNVYMLLTGKESGPRLYLFLGALNKEMYISLLEFQMINIVLVEPEIPQNTGNIVRTVSATGSKLYLVKPLGFVLDDKHFKRAGMDYITTADFEVVDSFEEIYEKNKDKQFFFASTKAPKSYCEVSYPNDCFLVFGKESFGLKESLLKEHYNDCIRIPMKQNTRSLNLSNSVAIVVYEALRQNNFKNLQSEGHLTGRID